MHSEGYSVLRRVYDEQDSKTTSRLCDRRGPAIGEGLGETRGKSDQMRHLESRELLGIPIIIKN